MSKVRKWDGEGTFAGTRGNDGVAPKADIGAAFAEGDNMTERSAKAATPENV